MSARYATGMAIAIFITSTLPATASAQLMQNLTIGNAKAIALGNAVTADPPGVDSIHFNPAGLVQIDGRDFLWGPFIRVNQRIRCGAMSVLR